MFLIYNLLSLASLIVYLPWLLLKKGPENRLAYIKERLGTSEYKKADIWIHAVSVGEILAALPFLKALKKEFPETSMVLSTTTYTGQKIARERFPEADRIMYMPWDSPFTVSNAVKLIKPKIFITIETELWPCLFRTLKGSGSHILLLNGRVSPQAFKGYKKIKPFMKRVLADIDFIYTQGQIYAERIIAIGANKEKVGIMGSFKFDIEFDKQNPPEWLNGVKGPVLLAGSTHKGEEEIILDAYKDIKRSMADLKLILAPRHPERFTDAEETIRKRNFNFIRRSEIKTRNTEHGTRNTDIILLDTIGELPHLFSGIDIAFIGGSLLPYGGHNILEPAYWGKPVVFGPHMNNFPIAEEFLHKGAAIMVKDSEELAGAVKTLLEDKKRAEEMGRKAKTIVDSNRGAVKKALDLVRNFIGVQDK